MKFHGKTYRDKAGPILFALQCYFIDTCGGRSQHKIVDEI